MHLDRLIEVLEVVATAGRPVTAREVQQATRIPKPTSYRLLQSLQDQRLLQAQGGDGGYVIGDRLIRIALLGKSDLDVCQVAAPLLQGATAAFNETVFLARFRNSRVELIHVETPRDPSRAYIHPGLGERPLHACSCSKAIAAFAEPDFQDFILRRAMRKYTEHTKITAAQLRQDFDQIRAQGFADCDQEIDIGVASVAAPIMVGNIGASFSVGAVGPIRRFQQQYRRQIGQELTVLATKISGAIQLCPAA